MIGDRVLQNKFSKTKKNCPIIIINTCLFEVNKDHSPFGIWNFKSEMILMGRGMLHQSLLTSQHAVRITYVS